MNTIFSKTKITFDRTGDVIENGYEIASVFDAVMDEDFVRQSRYDWCWLNPKDVPTETGWYKVDRCEKRLDKIDDEAAPELEWHERLFVYGSGHAAVSEHLPLALYIGDEYADSRLSGLYLCGPDVLTWVALKKV
jgi:hypothetical protein